MTDEAIFSRVLTPLERLLWTGRPDPAGGPRIWNNLKWYLVIFLLVWGALRTRNFETAVAWLVLVPGAIALILHGLDVFARRKLRRSAYAITTRRLICAEGPPYRFRTLQLDQVIVTFFPSGDGEGGLGSIRFQSPTSSWIRLGHPDDLPWVGPLVCGVPDITPLIRRAQVELSDAMESPGRSSALGAAALPVK